VGKIFDAIDERLRAWIDAQALFFVGTAPLGVDGHVNISPKAPIGSLRVLGPHTLAYLDVIGSGAETIAHLRENRRIVVMICAFAGPPRIVRFHGKGRVVFAGEPAFDELVARGAFVDPSVPEVRRAIIVVDVTRIADSCGYGVPLMHYEGARTQMVAWGERKIAAGPDTLEKYVHEKNARSVDGLPAVPTRG
jgi:hypothetical protein